MKSEPLRVESTDVVALVVAGTSVALFLFGHRAQAALAGAGALTLLTVGSWIRAKRAQKQLACLKAERQAFIEKLDRLEPLAASGLASVGLAHELKNDLMVTQGFARLTNQALEKQALPQAQAHLEVVETQTLKLIDRIKSFVRLAAPHRAPESRPLGAVVDELVRLVSPLAAQREVAFETTFDDLASMSRPVTAPDFQSALLDLLLNAIEHAESKVRFELESTAAFVLSVQDDGAGITPEFSATLFEPFASGRPGGLGIGLHRALAAVEREGGTLQWVKTNTGARFIVTLPASVIKSDP